MQTKLHSVVSLTCISKEKSFEHGRAIIIRAVILAVFLHGYLAAVPPVPEVCQEVPSAGHDFRGSEGVPHK